MFNLDGSAAAAAAAAMDSDHTDSDGDTVDELPHKDLSLDAH